MPAMNLPSDRPPLPASQPVRRRPVATLQDLGRWVAAPERARLRRLAGWAVMLAVAAWLVLRLGDIGWAELWAARPSSPLYYVLVLAAYLVLPVADTLIYRRLWAIRFWPSLPAFLRKRIYNSALLGYSGEVYLLMWARKRVDQVDRALAHAIKDTNILSAVVSTYVLAALILYLITQTAFGFSDDAFGWWAAGTLLFAALAPGAFLFRRHFMVLSAGTALFVLFVHTVRFLGGQALLLAQWRVELPEIGWTALATLLAAQMLVSRIPFLPNRDLLFISIGISLAGPLAMPQAALASLLLMTSALQQVLHLVVMLATSVRLSGWRKNVAP
jgi:hypothetical protein